MYEEETKEDPDFILFGLKRCQTTKEMLSI